MNLYLKEKFNQLPPELRNIIVKYTVNICIYCNNNNIAEYELKRHHPRHLKFKCIECIILQNLKKEKIKKIFGI